MVMVIRLMTNMADQTGCYPAGAEVDLPTAKARELIAGRYAEAVTAEAVAAELVTAEVEQKLRTAVKPKPAKRRAKKCTSKNTN